MGYSVILFKYLIFLVLFICIEGNTCYKEYVDVREQTGVIIYLLPPLYWNQALH